MLPGTHHKNGAAGYSLYDQSLEVGSTAGPESLLIVSALLFIDAMLPYCAHSVVHPTPSVINNHLEI